MTAPLAGFAGMSVLVVDDNPANVAYLRQLLTHQGLDRVHTETDPRRVPEHLSAYRPDLVLLDLHMPHVDGFDVLAQVRRFAGGGYLPVLVLTADTDTAARNRALAEGAQDFLTKPVDATEATLRIANLLNTRHLYSNLRRVAPLHGSPLATYPDDRTEVMARVRAELEEGTVTAVFQPVVDLSDLTVVGHEGLSRFPDASLRGPDRWFSDAFAVGLGVELERLAAQAVLRYFESAPPTTFLAVNMSPSTVLSLAEAPLCPDELYPRVVVELTEHVPVEDYAALHRALAPMRAGGARLSADDLGSGHAGLRHLVRLQADVVKLDSSLVAGIQHNREQRALVRALLAFAADVDAQVVAEGIEDADELATLQDLGVPYGQGYLLGRPAPLLAPYEGPCGAPGG